MATATAAALFGMDCVVYMGEVDIERQKLNVFRMRLLGAEVRPALSGSRTLGSINGHARLGSDWRFPLLLGISNGPSPLSMDGQRIHRVIGLRLILNVRHPRSNPM